RPHLDILAVRLHTHWYADYALESQRLQGTTGVACGGVDVSDRASVAFDPFELPDTIQLGTDNDPYPLLAAARRRGSVQLDWPIADDIAGGAPGDDPFASVLGHDEVVAVLRDHETYSSSIIGELMGPALDGGLITMSEPEHRAHRALIAPAFRPKLLA